MYYAAFRIPDFIYSVFYLGVVSVLFLPIFNDLYAKNRDQAWRFFGAMMNWVLIMLGAAALVLLFAAPAIVKLMVPGFSPQQISIVANMTRLMLIQPIILGVSNIISGALQSFGRFAAASMGHISYNAGIIFGILVLVPSFGIYGLVGGVLVGAFLHLAMQLPSFNQIRENFTFRLASDFQIVKPYVKLIPPRMFNVASNQINALFVTILASGAASGSLAAFSLAHDIANLPYGIIAHSLAIAAFPTLARLAFHDREKFSHSVNGALKKIVFFLIPISLFLIVFRAQIVRLTLGYGKFDWDDTMLTLNALLIFSWGIVFYGLAPLLIRVFFALQNTVIPFIAALTGNIITIGMGLMLIRAEGFFGGIVGLSLAVVAGQIMTTLILIVSLAKRALLDTSWFVKKGSLIALASVAAAASGRLWLGAFEFFYNERAFGLALQTGFSMVGTLAVLVILFKRFKIEELDQTLRALKQKFSR